MKIWKTCIYFQFHLILVVNVDRVTYLGQSAECLCSQKDERQQRKPVIDGIKNEKEKKKKKFRIPYNTKI